MKIKDPHKMIPDHSVLEKIALTHPFSPHLYEQIQICVISQDESVRPSPSINFNKEIFEATLIVTPQLHQWPNYEYILYHELGHVADQLNPKFTYSEKLKSELSDNEQFALMEVWNLYIDSRLNSHGIFKLGPNNENVYCRINGKLQISPCSIEGKLLCHISALKSVGVKMADSLVKKIWEYPNVSKSYSELISLIKQNENNYKIKNLTKNI